MNNRAYYDLEKHLSKLYEAKEYQQVLALIEQEQVNFPMRTLDFLYWRLCMINLLGRQAEALQLFSELIEQGNWVEPTWLLKDEDLTSLHHLPEFQSLIAICQQRLVEAQATAQPELLVYPSYAHKLPCMIALHGNMDNAQNTSEEWHEIIKQGWLLAVPQSTQVMGMTNYVWNNRERSIHEVCTHFATLNEKHAIDTERVVLGGFSKGGGLAIWLTLHQLVSVRGFVVLGPSLKNDELEMFPSLLATRNLTGVRGYIIVGEEDEHCLRVSHQVTEIMHAHDLPCKLEILSGVSHEYPPDFSERVTQGLAFVEQR